MAYVAVTGGREAIEQSLKLLEIFRDSKTDISVSCIKDNMGLLIDKIMSEAGFYSREYAALALKQCEGSVEEAVFLLRAYRSTLPRNYYSLPVDTSDMRLIRRISAAFKDIPGGQILGPTYDYSHRLLDFSLMDGEENNRQQKKKEKVSEDTGRSVAKEGYDIRCGRVTDILKKEKVLAETEEDNTPPFDVTSDVLTFPAPRSARLQTFARSDAVSLAGWPTVPCGDTGRSIQRFLNCAAAMSKSASPMYWMNLRKSVSGIFWSQRSRRLSPPTRKQRKSLIK